MLVDMVQKGNVCAFITSELNGGTPNILTFSLISPPIELYREGKRMIVKEIK